MSRSKPGPGGPARLRPMILFLLLTMMTFGGPLAIVLVGRGGDRPSWPPDRPVEWWVFGGVTIGYLLLLLACIFDASLTLRKARRADSQAPTDDESDRGDAPKRGPEAEQ